MNKKTIVIFEQIKKTNQYEQEYWSARELANILGYADFRNFEKVIQKAKESCKNADQPINDHFVDITKMIELGKSASRIVGDTALSRYACYLIVQNADPSKEIVALGQTYFAIQTRRQEVQDQVIEDQKRVYLRNEITTHNKHLAQTANRAGVRNYAIFTNYGYMGLYGGLKSKDIIKKKRLKKIKNKQLDS